jgi:sigma-B regulation protein RsbU (phosphoserine phosphatase)
MSMEVRNGSKILVVDDEPDLELMVRTKFRKQIKQNELEFVFAHNGQEALDRLVEDAAIDLVMSDINMPVMDGLTLLSRLPTSNRILKAVIVSAYGDMQNIRTAMNRGAYDFLMKPIDFEDFEVTVNKTRRAIDEIKQGARAKDQLSAIQHELRVATRIQQSILPRTFPPFPERKDFSIFAEMNAAKEVGGDFYDFFLIDDNRLGFVVGDVSGKGVPASILMAVSRTLLRATAMTAESAGECLNYVNQVLVRQSDPAMFVTIFYGILHTDTGELEFSIGGHNPPFLFSQARGVEMMQAKGGMIVGMIEQATYTTERIQL